jgi:hypothetical protein
MRAAPSLPVLEAVEHLGLQLHCRLCRRWVLSSQSSDHLSQQAQQRTSARPGAISCFFPLSRHPSYVLFSGPHRKASLILLEVQRGLQTLELHSRFTMVSGQGLLTRGVSYTPQTFLE